MSEDISDAPPFQNLLFLIRDWNLDDTEGYDGGEILLKKRLEVTPKMNEEKRELRQHIQSCFKVKLFFLVDILFYYLLHSDWQYEIQILPIEGAQKVQTPKLKFRVSKLF